MQVFIVGSGKLASELLEHLSLAPPFEIHRWQGAPAIRERAIVVHAGSGRELDEAVAFCERSGSALVELSTGSALEARPPACPVVLCPNTNILMLKFMAMLDRAGPLFAGSRISITESHQAGKTSTAGTAVAMAASLGLGAGDVVSVRDPAEQQGALGIPPEHLPRHAVHVISIDDGACSIAMETRVYGASPYADGVARIVSAVHAHPLANGVHSIAEFIERGWI
ncbi:dihydrodipicolinate reductase [Ramlibacter sp. G-1-2-2]|uniref:Dihydrodipicolinate reductase n=1 Tax=Ramlibacter agri TaxID=2728837 RepID=A0A848GZN4_9BURK|nr:dihydrodipicolinate reductase C-terminal domain-containing protein [Ramlibacter agri]NML42270.1 dihydrodipicolinate reductase [Ramlibacter agri]